MDSHQIGQALAIVLGVILVIEIGIIIHKIEMIRFDVHIIRVD